ncbi:hypothetical protein HETIRDRAFT_100932 [Heterobasidion irregulare TC 32-1]|uniref:Uncharacterized protein n=1 Tax=Heterobasidion irregulare (strain TC 32-1) TaxID=747525 RepID=W4KI80_HETIT|nr:uncharacterized protein HETIRDRAFT_100932 [Heterobasidion irregulare TC 32-1]ETW85399.1 hypothetical protein HETIRDRAFT_100932 [Heterobasidion irregulare TC 32-1]
MTFWLNAAVDAYQLSSSSAGGLAKELYGRLACPVEVTMTDSRLNRSREVLVLVIDTGEDRGFDYRILVFTRPKVDREIKDHAWLSVHCQLILKDRIVNGRELTGVLQ